VEDSEAESHCECFDGYTLVFDRFCVDVDECEVCGWFTIYQD